MQDKVISVIIIFVIVLLGFFLYSIIQSSDIKEIEEWAKKNNVETNTIERTVINPGPFWPDKNSRFYKVTLTNSKIVWFRFNIFGMDIEYENL